MLPYEAQFLKMIDRLDYRDEMSYEQRKLKYLAQLTFWNDFLNRHQPHATVFFNLPHEMYDYVLYGLCKLRKIPTLIFDDLNYLPDTLFLIENIEESAIQIHHELKRIQSENKPIVLGKTGPYLKRFLSETKTHMPQIIVEQVRDKKLSEHKMLKVRHLLQRIPHLLRDPFKVLTPDFWYRRKYSIESKENKLFSFYDSHALTQPDLNKKYIFMALHYQPECATSPMGGVYAEQHLVASLIAKSLPPGFVLYIKEHPVQKKCGRSIELYKNLLALPNTYLISRTRSSFDLIQNAAGVATITGTAGWEGFLRQRPVLIFGFSFYQYAPGIFRVRSAESCRSALSAIAAGYKPDPQGPEQYLAACEAASIHGWWMGVNKEPMTQLKSEDVIENITKALEERLKKLVPANLFNDSSDRQVN
jgi:hypothetical protein